MSFKHHHSLNPILALEFYTYNGQLLILASEGPFLRVFDADSSELIAQCRVFDEQAIHGIITRELPDAVNDLEVVIWGGPCLTLLSKSQVENLICQNWISITQCAVMANDWVLSINFCPWGQQSCVMVTAHNAMLQATLPEDHTSKPTPLKQLQLSSRSMLYSASLVCENKDTVIVAAGTIFGEIIVWKCVARQESRIFLSEVLFVFTGHEGSIFGVDISPVIVDREGKSTRLLASCSDDRTIRIWDLAHAPRRDVTTDVLARELMPRETGFGENPQPAEGSDTSDRCVAVTMAHASRIWGVKFDCCDAIDKTYPITVLSFGEDSTAQQWEIQLENKLYQDTQTTGAPVVANSRLNSSSPFQLLHIETFAFHTGKHIWSAAIARRKYDQKILATGGADGKIASYAFGNTRKYDLPSSLLNRADAKSNMIQQTLEGSYNSFVFELEEVFRSLSSTPSSFLGKRDSTAISKKKTPKDAFNRYAFLSENVFIVTTTFGRVLKATILKSIVFEELDLPTPNSQDLKSYSIVAGAPAMGLCFLTGTNGTILLYQIGSPIVQVGKVDRKPSDMFIVRTADDKTLELLVTLVGTQDLLIFPLEINSVTPHPLETKRTLSLPPKFVVTGAGRCDSLLVLGSREGHIAVYDTISNSFQSWGPKYTGTADAITSIVVIPSSDDASSQIRSFATTSRNGTYSVFSFIGAGDANTSKIKCMHRASPPFGPMIEACWFQGTDLILYGFKSKSLVVWNETKQSEIMRVECGGCHRAHAYSALKSDSGGGSGHLVYTKASKLYFHSQSLPSHRTVTSGGHGREIKTCAVLSGHNLMATGAEDTNIRLWRYQEHSPRDFNCHTVIQKHTSGIQHLQWHGPSYLFSSGGVEEFYIWAIQEIPGFGIGVVCEASCPDPTEEQDLRIMGFDVSDAPVTTDKEPSLLISLAYSDSTMRTYSYSKTGGFTLLVRGQYTSACLTKIHHLQISENDLYLLTTATDGSLCTWRAPLDALLQGSVQVSDFSLISHKRVHQSAVKSLDVTMMNSGERIIVATGGDDNALGITIYTARGTSSIFETKPETVIIPSAHAAAVTGLACVLASQSDADAIKIVSSSTDQRVKTWDVKFGVIDRNENDVCPLGIELSGDEFTSVSDIGDVAMLDDGAGKKAIVVGNGMDVWCLEE